MKKKCQKYLLYTFIEKQAHLEELTQMKLIKQVLLRSSCQDYVTNLNHYISTSTRVLMTTNLGRMVTNLERVVPIMFLDSLVIGLARSRGKL